MSFHNGLSRALYRSVILLGMAILWHRFAPIQFGGQASYVIVAGASMEPSLRAGDLVIARTSDEYKI